MKAREATANGDRPLGTPNQVGLWELIKEDKATNQESLLRPGFHAMLMYRLGHWADEAPHRRRPVLWLAKALRLFVRNFYGIEMYWGGRIGRRLVIGHQGAIVVHEFCTIGDDCVIRQGVTIGAADEFIAEDAPILGNNVDIGAGAIIVGKVRIGNNVRIGPNTVVTTDIADNSTVLPPPSRVVSWG